MVLMLLVGEVGTVAMPTVGDFMVKKLVAADFGVAGVLLVGEVGMTGVAAVGGLRVKKPAVGEFVVISILLVGDVGMAGVPLVLDGEFKTPMPLKCDDGMVAMSLVGKLACASASCRGGVMAGAIAVEYV